MVGYTSSSTRQHQRMQLQVIPAERVTPSMSVMHPSLRTPALTPLPSLQRLVSAFGNHIPSETQQNLIHKVHSIYSTYLQSLQVYTLSSPRNLLMSTNHVVRVTAELLRRPGLCYALPIADA